jgi:hypothetical protein
MAKVNLNITGNYTIKYINGGHKVKSTDCFPQVIDVDKNSKIRLSIYNEKNVFLTILKKSLYGFIEIFLICFPSYETSIYKKYNFIVVDEETTITISKKKLYGLDNYKKYHIDFLIDFISFICMILILAFIVYLAIIFHWFEK